MSDGSGDEFEEFSGVGRNEPCPCGSGLKYKRCHGRVAKDPPPDQGTPAFSPDQMSQFDPNQMDPEWAAQMGNALKRLPRGQMAKLQQIMQKAMAGKDVSREAAALEKTLPPDLQGMLKNAPVPGMGDVSAGAETDEIDPSQMTEDQAREILRQASEAGMLSEKDSVSSEAADQEKAGALSGLWKKIKGK